MAVLVDLSPAGFGQDRRVRVAQHHHRALDHPLRLGMTLLVEGEAVLQGFIHDGLHPLVHRGVHEDPPLEEILHREAVLLQLGENGVDGGRGLRLDRVLGRDEERLGL